jgi:hypothetical protein
MKQFSTDKVNDASHTSTGSSFPKVDITMAGVAEGNKIFLGVIPQSAAILQMMNLKVLSRSA